MCYSTQYSLIENIPAEIYTTVYLFIIDDISSLYAYDNENSFSLMYSKNCKTRKLAGQTTR